MLLRSGMWMSPRTLLGAQWRGGGAATTLVRASLDYKPFSSAAMLVSSSPAIACNASTPGSAFPCSMAEICWREKPVWAASSVLLNPFRSLSLVIRVPISINSALPAIPYIIDAGVNFLRQVYLTE